METPARVYLLLSHCPFLGMWRLLSSPRKVVSLGAPGGSVPPQGSTAE